MTEQPSALDAWESLFRAQVTVLRELQEEFPTAQLSLNEYDVLFNLSRQPRQTVRLRDLNKLLLITQPSVSRLIDRLTARGLVRKEPDPGDGRGTLVCLTGDGESQFRKVAAAHSRAIQRRVGDVLSTDELAELTRITTKLREG